MANERGKRWSVQKIYETFVRPVLIVGVGSILVWICYTS